MPVNPAPLQMACALLRCCPISWGAGRVHGVGAGVGVGRGVGLGVGLGVGRGVGKGVGRAVGTGVGRAVGTGVASGVGAAPSDGKTTASLGMGDSLPEASEAAADDALGAPAEPPDNDGGGDRRGDDVVMVAGVPSVPTTPAGRNGFPMMNANANAARATIPRAIGVLGIVGRGSGAMRFGRVTPPSATTASDTLQAGHEPFASAQHLSHASTRQAGHVDSPIPARVAAGPIRLRHFSQDGSGAALDGEVAPGEVMWTIESRRNRRTPDGLRRTTRRDLLVPRAPCSSSPRATGPQHRPRNNPTRSQTGSVAPPQRRNSSPSSRCATSAREALVESRPPLHLLRDLADPAACSSGSGTLFAAD